MKGVVIVQTAVSWWSSGWPFEMHFRAGSKGGKTLPARYGPTAGMRERYAEIERRLATPGEQDRALRAYLDALWAAGQ